MATFYSGSIEQPSIFSKLPFPVQVQTW